jgi:hypothetical protein
MFSISLETARFDSSSLTEPRHCLSKVTGGKVTVTPPPVFRKLVDNVIPIFKAKGNKPCVIIPPIPRCLFSRCCGDVSHCTNVSDSNFAETMLTGFLRQRTDLIRQLVQSGLTNFKVLDSCCTTSCAATASVSDRIAALQKTTWSDGIHYTVIWPKERLLA